MFNSASGDLRRVVLGVLFGGIVLTSLSALSLAGEASNVFQVGVAQIDVTPDYPIRLNGFLVRKEESTGVRLPIFVRAIAFGSDEESPAVIVTTELLGIPEQMTQAVAKNLQQKVGLDPFRLSITATHSHSAPFINGVAPNIFGEAIPADAQAKIDKYTAFFQEQLEAVVIAALKDRRPATLSFGISKATFAKNRRIPDGPVDHDLPVLAVHDLEGKLRALYVNYACHCVTLSDSLISGDWAGYAADHLNRLYPEAITLVSVGCGADSNPASGVTGSKWEVASQQGLEIASAVEKLLSIKMRPVTGPIQIQNERISLPLTPAPIREQFVELAQKNDPTGYFARVQLEKLDRGETLRTAISYQVQTWSFGESLAMVFLPGEVVAEYALRLKRELDPRRLWMNSYANDAPCYIPSEAVLAKGAYEGKGSLIYYDQPAPFGVGIENRIVQAVRKQLDGKFKANVDSTKTQGSRPPAPEEAVLSLKTLPGLTVDLIAAEPLVTSPVAIDFGPDGKLWVCEMYDYPQGLDGRFQPGGRVRLLEATKTPGDFDRSTVFLEGIPFPTGVTVWKKGVLICAAPDILYAEDTNQDGKADIVRKLFSGFGTENFQARVNSLEYGLDGWVYGSCGLFGGTITSFNGKPPVELGNRDFRFNPETGDIEPATGRTQQGRVRDDWDNWFGCDNSNFLRHLPLADHVVRRNPHVTTATAFVSVPADAEASRVYPATSNLQLFKLSGKDGRATAACGLGIYRDDLLGNEFRGDAFTCEPVSLVVHRLKLTPSKSSFRGDRPADEQQREFLASTNNWFRPVQVKTGPDGGLYVVDMSRFVIEHPRWIPEESLAEIDPRAGHDMGRIYRVRSQNIPARAWPRLDQLSADELVAALNSSNGWVRDMAMQLLLWNPDASVGPALETLAQTAERPETRLQALCTLDCLKLITPELLLVSLKDRHPGVRRHAVRISESHLSPSAELAEALLHLVDDADPQVRLQLASTLGGLQHPEVNAALLKLMFHPQADVFLTTAALSGVSQTNVDDLLNSVVQMPDSPTRTTLIHQFLGIAVSVHSPEQLGPVLAVVTTPNESGYAAWQWASLARVFGVLQRRKIELNAFPSAIRTPVTEMMNVARSQVQTRESSDSQRVLAIQVFGYQGEGLQEDFNLLAGLLTPGESPVVQTAAVAALGRLNTDSVPALLFKKWNSFSPALRGQVLDLLLSRPEWQLSLLKAVQERTASPAIIDLPRRQRLLASNQQEIQTLATKLFSAEGQGSRQSVLQSYRPVLDLTGQVHRGREVFVEACSVCHRLGEVGYAIGPDLVPQAGKSVEFLMQEILDPNKNVDSRFVSYIALTESGRAVSGLLQSETATSITLVGQQGKQETLLRSELDELVSSGQSLMPEGFEKLIDHQKMADLIAFLKSSEASSK